MRRLLHFFLLASVTLISTQVNAQQWKTLIFETFGTGAALRSADPTSAILPGTTDYLVAPAAGTSRLGSVNDGYYTVGQTPAAFVPATTTPWLVGLPDHTPGDANGYMMTINANPGRQGETNGTYYLYSTASFDIPGATYAIDFWGANILKMAPDVPSGYKDGLIGLAIRDGVNSTGTLFGTASYTLLRTTDNTYTSLPWQNESLQFMLPVNYTGNRLYFNFYNRDTNPSTNGNDFVLDDLRIRMLVVTLSGSIFNDYDADGVRDAGEPGIDGTATPVYAYLTKADGTIVSKVQVRPDGTYAFTTDQGVPFAANDIGLRIVVSSSNVTGAIATSQILGFQTVSENAGGNQGVATGTVDGTMQVTRSDVDMASINFGINELPTAADNTVSGLVNPGGSDSAPVASAAFAGSEVTGGQVASIIIKSFPSNAESIIVDGVTYLSSDAIWGNGGIQVPADVNGHPALAISVNPSDGAVGVVIPYAAKDNLGIESALANVTVQFEDLTVSGTIYLDGNGGIIDGTGSNIAGANTLYVILTDVDGTTVIGSVPVQGDGSYSLGTANGVASNSNYQLVLANLPGTPGEPVPSTDLINTLHTAEGEGGTAGDGNPDGRTILSVGSTGMSGINFGINQKPTAASQLANITQPSGGSELTLDGTNLPVPSGADPEDGNLAAGKNIIINAVPVNSKLYYDNVLITDGTRIPNLDPRLLKLVLDNTTTGETGTSFDFSYEDAAGLISTPATYEVIWPQPLPVKLISFEGVVAESKVLLRWRTSMEENADRFEIERSLNARTWERVGDLAVLAFSSKEKHYQFIDSKPLLGMGYYRLKMVDKDESYAYSSVIDIYTPKTKAYVYPNPGSDQIYIQGIDWTSIKSVRLANAAGQTVYEGNPVKNGIDIRNLIPGVYVLTLIDTNNEISTLKIVKR